MSPTAGPPNRHERRHLLQRARGWKATRVDMGAHSGNQRPCPGPLHPARGPACIDLRRPGPGASWGGPPRAFSAGSEWRRPRPERLRMAKARRPVAGSTAKHRGVEQVAWLRLPYIPRITPRFYRWAGTRLTAGRQARYIRRRGREVRGAQGQPAPAKVARGQARTAET